jgi:cytochrome c556
MTATESREFWYQRAQAFKAENVRLRKALAEIAKGKGQYDLDPFTHACNTIEDMKQAAKDALAGKEVEKP